MEIERKQYLDGLIPEHADIVRNYALQVDIDKFNNNESAIQIFIPVIKHIVRQIVDTKNLPYPEINFTNYSDRGVTTDKLLNEININELTDSLYEYCQYFIPNAENYLPNIDAHAEMSLLFCRNYLMKILDNVIKNDTIRRSNQ
jgi:hypothetical protein